MEGMWCQQVCGCNRLGFGNKCKLVDNVSKCRTCYLAGLTLNVGEHVQLFVVSIGRKAVSFDILLLYIHLPRVHVY